MLGVLGFFAFMYSFYIRPVQINLLSLDNPPRGSYECVGTFGDFSSTVSAYVYISNGRVRGQLISESESSRFVFNGLTLGDGLGYVWDEKASSGSTLSVNQGFWNGSAGIKRDQVKNLTCERRIYIDNSLFVVPNDVHFATLPQ